MAEGAPAPSFQFKPGDISKEMAALAASLDRGAASAKTEATRLKLFSDALDKSSKKTEQATKIVKSLKDNIQYLADGSDQAAKAASALADDFAAGMKTMSTSQKAAFDKMMKDIEAAEGAAGGAKNERDLNTLAGQRRKMETQGYQDALRQEELKGQAMQNSGQIIKGSFQSLIAKSLQWKSVAIGGIGEFLGLTAKTMLTLTKLITLPLAILTGLDAILKGTSKHAAEAAKAGFDIGESQGSMIKAGDNMAQALDMAALSGGMARKQLLELSDVFNVEMGHSIADTADGTVNLVKGLGGVGLTFGIAAEEAVKLGTKLGVMGRAGIGGTRVLFENLGERANDLNVNLEVLVDPMMQLAEISGAAGAGIMDSVSGFNAVVGAAQGLAAVGGPFNSMFASMRDADKAKAVQKFAASFSKISDIQWSAFSMKKGDNFFDTVGKVSGAGMEKKLGYIDDLTKKLGINNMKNQVQKEFTLGSVLSGGALTGDYKASRELGRMALLAKEQGKGFNAEAQTAALIDQRFQRRESVGQFIAGGGDVLSLIAHRIGAIYDLLVSSVSNISGILSHIPGVSWAAAIPGSSYGAGAANAGRQVPPVRSAAMLAK